MPLVPSVSAVPEALADEWWGPPGPGRVFTNGRRVRLSDVDTTGRLRYDAVARYLQDVATDDVREAGVEDAIAWVVRRTTVVMLGRPRYGEQVDLTTWCSGAGPALAERRTRIISEAGARVETVSIWVSLDRRTLRPTPFQDVHFAPYRQQAGARRVRGRFRLPAEWPDRAGGPVAWPLRGSDFDLYRHVNNVVAWTVAEDLCGSADPGDPFGWGQVEYRRPIGSGEEPVAWTAPGADACGLWLVGAEGVAAVSARMGR